MSRIDSPRSVAVRSLPARKYAFAVLALVGAFVAYTAYERAISRVCCALPPMHFPGDPPSRRPADLAFDLSGQTGSLAPRYFNRYRLQMGADRIARFTYSPGYEANGPAWTSDFRVSDVALDTLWMEFRRSALRHTPPAPPIAPGDRADGAGSQSMTVTASGVTVTLDGSRRDEWMTPVNQFMHDVAAIVPDSVRGPLRARHEAWAALTFGPSPAAR